MRAWIVLYQVLLFADFSFVVSFAPPFVKQNITPRRVGSRLKNIERGGRRRTLWHSHSREIGTSLSCPPLQSFLSHIESSSSVVVSSAADEIATSLGYFVGAISIILYTPIAIRLVRQGNARGLTYSTWWLKLISYTCSDVYAYTHGYPLSTYVEMLFVTAEATTILLLVANFERHITDPKFALTAAAYLSLVAWALSDYASPDVIALGQFAAPIINIGALVPQLIQNAERKTGGDYSPVTASLATIGCSIRLFTTVQLNGSDPLLLEAFGLGLIVNGALAAQILFYGMIVEGKSLSAVLTSDVSKRPYETEQNEQNEQSEQNERFREIFNVELLNGLTDTFVTKPVKVKTTKPW